MNFCPQCGNPLSSLSVKFCPECGCKLPLNQLQGIDIICPDCNTVITNPDEDCPICGCPSNLFTKRAKTKYMRGEVLECPDCGKVFEETIPIECPYCGCPSDMFKHHNEEVRNSSSFQQKKNVIKPMLIVILLILFVGGGYYLVRQQVERTKEQARQEQYAKEQRIRKEKEAAEAKKIEQENEAFLNKIVGTYTSPYMNFRGEYIRYRIKLSKSKRYTIETLGYNYRVLSSQSGTFEPVARSKGCVLNPNTSNSSWINVVGSHLELGDIEFY